MGETGLALVEKELPKLRHDYKLDIVIAQAENVSRGKGCTPEDFTRLKKAGIDFCTGGNWTIWEKSILPQLNDPNQPIIRPANYPSGTPGLGWKYLHSPFGLILIVSLLGKIVGRESNMKLDNPLRVIDEILNAEIQTKKAAIVVNLHGDYSSEKVVVGHYLNGRATAVIGDHWHVPTADARVLSKGTAHITDAGMVGVLDSSLGIKTSLITERWRDGVVNVNELETDKPWQLNGLLFEVDTSTSKALSAKSINLVFQ